MHKTQFASIFFKYSLATLLLFISYSLRLNRYEKTLAETTTNNSVCNSRNPYNLVADTTKIRRINISWEVCQTNDFYQVGKGDDENDIAQIDDPKARNWTYVGARDDTRYKFKIRGCNKIPAQGSTQTPDCTPWSELVVTTPDW